MPAAALIAESTGSAMADIRSGVSYEWRVVSVEGSMFDARPKRTGRLHPDEPEQPPLLNNPLQRGAKGIKRPPGLQGVNYLGQNARPELWTSPASRDFTSTGVPGCRWGLTHIFIFPRRQTKRAQPASPDSPREVIRQCLQLTGSFSCPTRSFTACGVLRQAIIGGSLENLRGKTSADDGPSQRSNSPIP